MKITPEKAEEIRKLNDLGITQRDIGLRVGLSQSVVCHTIRGRPKANIEPKRAHKTYDEVDYSKLPDRILFNPKHYPVFGLLLVLLLSSCTSSKDFLGHNYNGNLRHHKQTDCPKQP